MAGSPLLASRKLTTDRDQEMIRRICLQCQATVGHWIKYVSSKVYRIIGMFQRAESCTDVGTLRSDIAFVQGAPGGLSTARVQNTAISNGLLGDPPLADAD